VGDPAGIARSSISEESNFDALKRLGLAAFPAPSNDVDVRLRAVEALLGKQVNAGPALMISRKGCPWLCRGMSGGYRFKKTKEGSLRALPDKNSPEGFDHVCDCLQYVSQVVSGGLVNQYIQRSLPRKKIPHTAISALGWT